MLRIVKKNLGLNIILYIYHSVILCSVIGLDQRSVMLKIEGVIQLTLKTPN